MGSPRPDPDGSIAKADDPNPGQVVPRRRSGESAPRKRRTFLQVSSPEGLLADSQKPFGSAFESDNFQTRLDDICQYGISASQQAELWELERGRLFTAIDSTITHHPFTSIISASPNGAGFEILSSVASEAITNIEVCDFDNELCLFESRHVLSDRDQLSRARNAISARRETTSGGAKEANTNSHPVFPFSAEQRRRFYCALVDYVTVVVARCVRPVRGGSHGRWYADRIMSLARIAAKLKYLSIDSEGFASQSIGSQQKSDAFSLMAVNHAVDVKQNFLASSWALESLLSIFSDLICKSRQNDSGHCFNLGILAYESAWKDESIILHQDQHGEISGRCVRLAKWSISGTFETLQQISDTLGTLTYPGPHHFGPKASIRLQRYNASVVRREHVHTMYDIIAYMIPILCMRPKRLLQLNRPSGIVVESTMDLAPRNYTSFDLRELELPRFAELSIGETSIAEFNHSFSLLRRTLGKKDKTPVQPTEWATEENQNAHGQSWAIEERSIVVKRRLYATMFMVVCGILVIGGILTGSLVGERIPGVDPFNITTFAWVLAAFIIVIAKSHSVRDWPWHDFLHGQVACRSVSELRTVTGIDEQDILKYLLANDAYTILNTRGPYNNFHTRRSDDGFSIDVKIELRTLTASGIVVFRVATHMGPALVCLDLRRGVEGRTSIRHVEGPREGERLLGCFDFPEAIDGELDVQLQTLSKSMTWTRILGVYDNLDKKFR